VMFLWLLSLLGAVGSLSGKSEPWLAWFTCLFLAIAVFLVHWGVVRLP